MDTESRTESTSDGLSRCECCDRITPSDRLRREKLGWTQAGIRHIADLCRDCSDALGSLQMQLRVNDVTMSQLRAKIDR